MNTDWSQFWPSVIATLIGFFLAIVFQQIKTPVWDGVLNTNEIQLIADFCKIRKNYDNDLLTELLYVYSLISEYNKLNNLYAEQLAMGIDKENAKPVYDTIKTAYEELNGVKDKSIETINSKIKQLTEKN